MSKIFISLISVSIFFVFSNSLLTSDINSYFSNLEPKPGAVCVNRETSIIINPTSLVKRNTIFDSRSITVEGSTSGLHNGNFVNSDDNSSVIFKPYTGFDPGEKVSVRLNGIIKTTGGKSIEKFQYSFFVKTTDIKSDPLKYFNDEIEQSQKNNLTPYYFRDGVNDLPQLTVTNAQNPSEGFILMSSFSIAPNLPSFLLKVKNDAQVLFSRQTPKQCYDFKLQPNGNYTYFDNDALKFFEMDTNYNIIDSFYCGNGYSTDIHELRLLSNGHALMMSYDRVLVDSTWGSGGGTNVHSLIHVIGLIVQEIDENKTVIFQWRSWDHFKVADATHENLTIDNIDYVHGNAIEVDNDNNLLISSRHMDEITKISRTTGDIIWRLGGKNNEFTFINDPVGFSHQHAIRRINNGNITFFDNGNFHIPHFSRAVEYKLDEANKTATLVWQYRNNPDIYSAAMGYVQRLDNGNSVIGWGFANPTVSEVTSSGSIVYELTLPVGMYSYRSFRFNPTKPIIIPADYKLSQNYPNPFNPATRITFGLPEASGVKLTVYDILGREIVKLLDERRDAGTYEINWSGTNYSSGIYFYTLQTDKVTITKKMMLVK